MSSDVEKQYYRVDTPKGVFITDVPARYPNNPVHLLTTKDMEFIRAYDPNFGRSFRAEEVVKLFDMV